MGDRQSMVLQAGEGFSVKFSQVPYNILCLLIFELPVNEDDLVALRDELA